MTTPAVVDSIVTQATGLQPPVSAPVASPPAPDAVPLSKADRIARIASNVPPDAAPAEAPPRVELVRTQPQEEQEPPTSREIEGGLAPQSDGEATADSAPATDADDSAPPTPEEEQAALEQGFEVGTGDALFRVRDPESGKFVEAPKINVDLAIRDKDTGEIKVYTKSVAELARMARDGIAGQRHAQENQRLATQVQERDAYVAQMQDMLDAQIALNREILNDEERYLTRREQYLNANSPETRLAALQEEVQQERAARERAAAQQQFVQEANTFHTTRVQPVVTDAIAKLGEDAVLGRILRGTASITGPDGRIPREYWSQYAEFINGPFKAWVDAQAAGRTSAPPPSDDPAVTEERRKAQQRVQQVGRVTRPVGTAAPDRPAPLPPPKSFGEAKQRLIGRTTIE